MQLLIDHFYTRLNNIIICKEDDPDFLICKEDNKESKRHLARLARAYKYLLERYNKTNNNEIIHKMMLKAHMSEAEIKIMKKRLLRG